MDMTFLRKMTQMELFALYDAALCEMRSRGLTRSSNNPVADYTEWLAAKALGLSLQAGSTTGFDGTCKDGFKYEVKGRRRTPQNQSVQLSAIRGLEKRHFDYLIGVIFKADFTVDYAAKIPRQVIVERSSFRTHTNAHVFLLKTEILRDDRVSDITVALQKASESTS